jgi:hypothetical protein
MCYYSFDLPLAPKDLMRIAKTVGFTNTNYIKNNPDIFEKCLSKIQVEKNNTNSVDIKTNITSEEFAKIKYADITMFANMSLTSNRIRVPMLMDNFNLKKGIRLLLEEAHERTKKVLAEIRKDGTIPKNTNPKTPIKKPTAKPNLVKLILPPVSAEIIETKKIKKCWYEKTDTLFDNSYIDLMIEHINKTLEKEKIPIDREYWIKEIHRYKEYKRFISALRDLPLPFFFRECLSALRAIIKEITDENIEDVYRMLYKVGAVCSMMIPYSERKEQPGYNIMEKIPGGLLFKLPTPYEKFGYEKMSFSKTDIKNFIKMWGEPKTHTTMNEYYQDVWVKYEDKLEKL